MSEAPKTPHIQAAAYDFSKYVSAARWRSYYQQIIEALAARPQSLLVIGTGDGVVAQVLRHLLPDADIKTFDFHPGLHPDILGDVRDIRRLLGDRTYDCILCCQVLQHLPFSDFEPIVRDLAQCVVKRLVLSLPYHSAKLALTLELPRGRPLRWFCGIPRFWKRKWAYDGHHYWEIDSPNCPRANVANVLAKYFRVCNRYRVDFCEDHCFFILTPLASSPQPGPPCA